MSKIGYQIYEPIIRAYLQKQGTIIAFIYNTCAHMERVSEMDSNSPAYQGKVILIRAQRLRNKKKKMGCQERDNAFQISGCAILQIQVSMLLFSYHPQCSVSEE